MANRIRIVNFNDTITTTEAPTLARVAGATAVNTDEFVTKQQMVDYTADLEFATVANGAAIKAIALADREEGELKYTKDNGWWYYYASASTATGDDIDVLYPDDSPATGRWLRGKFIDTVNAQSVDGVKTFTSFPKKSGSGAALNPTQDGEFITRYFADNKYATSVSTGDLGSDVTALEKQVTELALNDEYGEYSGDYGLKTELFLDSDDRDTSIESASQPMCEVNGDDVNGIGNLAPYKTYQKDRESNVKKQGICQAHYKASYCEAVQQYDHRRFDSAIQDVAWDATRRMWWATGGRTIIAINEDLSEGLGVWNISGVTGGNGICVNGDTLFVVNTAAGTYGTVYKFTINSTGTTVGGQASGSTLAVGTSLVGTTSYNGLVGVACDGTDVYLTCWSTNTVAKAPMSLASWTTGYNIQSWIPVGYGSTPLRGIAYDGTRIWVGNTPANVAHVFNTAFTACYGLFTMSAPYGMEFKDGDIWVKADSTTNITRYKIAGTTRHEGMPIAAYKNPNPSEKIHDLEYVPNLLGAGVHGYLAVNDTNRIVRVFDTAFVEQTSGTPQTTNIGDGTGLTITKFTGICSDGTNVILSGQAAANGYILSILITDLDGSFAMSGANSKITTGQTGLTGVDIIPGTSNDQVIFYNQGDTNYRRGILSTGATNILFARPQNYAWSGFVSTGQTMAFKNARELYITDCSNQSLPPLVVDFAMSRYYGTGKFPTIIKVLANAAFPLQEGFSGATFDASGDLVVGAANQRIQYVLASDSADDEKCTGLAARRSRIYGAGDASGSYQVYYPYASQQTHSFKKAVAYRRKYAPSVYSDKRHVLPLNGIYAISDYSLTIIDAESNHTVMDFEIPTSSVALNSMLDGTGGAANTLKDIAVIDDKIFLGTSNYLHVIDFTKNKAYMLDGALYECTQGIENRNYYSTTFGNVWTTLNSSMTLQTGNANLRSISAKQDTTVEPSEHNGALATVDNGEIYVAYGTTTSGGFGFLRWNEQRTFIYSTTSTNNHVRIADDFTLFIGYLFGNNQLGRFGDIRKIYANNATVSWDTQTNTAYTYYDSSRGMLSSYFTDYDVRIVWENGVAKPYVLVSHGNAGTSTTVGLEIINWEAGKFDVINSGTSSTAFVGCAWGRDNVVYGVLSNNTDGASNTICECRKTNTNAWQIVYYAYQCATSAYHTTRYIVRSVTYGNNMILTAWDYSVVAFDRPRITSRYESKTFSVDQPEKMFYIANDSNGRTISGKVQERNVFSDVGDARFTFTNGSTNNWSAVYTSSDLFGGNDRSVVGQVSGTQPKVEWTTVSGTTEIILYVARQTNRGKYDLSIADTLLGTQNYVLDTYSGAGKTQDIYRVTGLTPEAHAVTLTARSDSNPASSGLNLDFQGCVELAETATDRALPVISYALSNDQDKSTKHWHTMSAEATSEDITNVELFSGDGGTLGFQLPTTNLGADIKKVELYIGAAWVEQTEGTAWTADSPISGRITVTFTVAPASGTDNIRITFVQQGTLAKGRFDITYGTGCTGLEEAWVNDVGYYTRAL